MARAQPLALLLLTAVVGTAEAGFLTGTVAYDPATRLYSYSYTLDDRSALAPIDQIYIRVPTDLYDPTLSPVSHTAPAPFADFSWYFGDGVGGPGGTMF